MRAIMIGLALACAGYQCVPSPSPVPPVPSVDASVDADMTSCGRARANAARLGCAELLRECDAVVDARLIRMFDPDCIATAADKVAIRKCAGMVCP